MKPVFKLSGTLILNQFLANIACGMCIIPFPFVLGNQLLTYILFLSLNFFFYYYISYHGAYKAGFHDVNRHSSEAYDNSYIKRGLLATLIAASPSIILLILWLIGRLINNGALKSSLYLLTMWNLFGSWPLRQIMPNHIFVDIIICIAVQIIFPMIGYISGYKGISYTQKIRDTINTYTKHK